MWNLSALLVCWARQSGLCFKRSLWLLFNLEVFWRSTGLSTNRVSRWLESTSTTKDFSLLFVGVWPWFACMCTLSAKLLSKKGALGNCSVLEVVAVYFPKSWSPDCGKPSEVSNDLLFDGVSSDLVASLVFSECYSLLPAVFPVMLEPPLSRPWRSSCDLVPLGTDFCKVMWVSCIPVKVNLSFTLLVTSTLRVWKVGLAMKGSWVEPSMIFHGLSFSNFSWSDLSPGMGLSSSGLVCVTCYIESPGEHFESFIFGLKLAPLTKWMVSLFSLRLACWLVSPALVSSFVVGSKVSTSTSDHFSLFISSIR